MSALNAPSEPLLAIRIFLYITASRSEIWRQRRFAVPLMHANARLPTESIGCDLAGLVATSAAMQKGSKCRHAQESPFLQTTTKREGQNYSPNISRCREIKRPRSERSSFGRGRRVGGDGDECISQPHKSHRRSSSQCLEPDQSGIHARFGVKSLGGQKLTSRGLGANARLVPLADIRFGMQL